MNIFRRALLLAAATPLALQAREQAEVVVYGATPGDIGAVVTAARQGRLA